jgi:hypothetical protein
MRGQRSRTIGEGELGLREERKALAVRYTLDAEEALRREELAPEVAAYEFAEDAAAPQSGEEQPVLRPSPVTQPAEYIIQLRGIRFLWRWAVFEGVAMGRNGGPPGSDPTHIVAAGLLPRLSERSARRAAERAARGAFRQAIVSG